MYRFLISYFMLHKESGQQSGVGNGMMVVGTEYPTWEDITRASQEIVLKAKTDSGLDVNVSIIAISRIAP